MPDSSLFMPNASPRPPGAYREEGERSALSGNRHTLTAPLGVIRAGFSLCRCRSVPFCRNAYAETLCHDAGREDMRIDVDDPIEFDHLILLITVLIGFATAGIIWLHFGR